MPSLFATLPVPAGITFDGDKRMLQGSIEDFFELQESIKGTLWRQPRPKRDEPVLVSSAVHDPDTGQPEEPKPGSDEERGVKAPPTFGRKKAEV